MFGNVEDITNKFPTVRYHGVDHKILIIAPRAGIVIGSYNGTAMHFCLFRKLFHNISTPGSSRLDDDMPGCEMHCPNPVEVIGSSKIEPQPSPSPSPAMFWTSLPSSSAPSPQTPNLTLPSVPSNTVPFPQASVPALLPVCNSHALPVVSFSSEREEEPLRALDRLLPSEPQYHQRDQMLKIRAPSTMVAATVLDKVLSSLLFYREPPADHEPWPAQVTVLNANVHALEQDSMSVVITASSDATVGKGPLAEVWSKFVDLQLTKNGSVCWVSLPKDSYLTPATIPLWDVEANSQLLNELRYLGFIICLGLQWQLDLFPLSLLFLTAVLHGPELADHPEFVARVCPMTTTKFDHLPSEPSVTIQDQGIVHEMFLALDVLSLADLQGRLTSIRGMPEAVFQKLLYAVRLFYLWAIPVASTFYGAEGHTPFYARSDGVIGLIREGVYTAIPNSTLNIQEVLGPFSRDYPNLLAAMYADRKINNHIQLASCISFRPVVASPAFSGSIQDLRNTQEHFINHFDTYLSQPGHVYGTVDADSDHWDGCNPHTLHSILFVEAASTSRYLPINPRDKIRIQFKTDISSQGLSDNAMAILRNSSAAFCTCFCMMAIFLTADFLENVLQMGGPPSDLTQHSFNQWFHSLLMHQVLFNDT
ncbi:hypothetical protein BKA70DRAFT_1438440 [Coprinopsis sp. MPI-PUGE-AT-0042]|nr:hypothetical protein BKA70DRAFT_1438440 [Coprinopsis sp. MPI-PUGE-AT-0042]